MNATDVGIFHPSRKPFRFTILIFVSLLTYGSYFAYDGLSAISPNMIASLEVTRAAWGATKTIYSVAAILCLLVGGILIDRIGTRRASLLFSSFIVFGALIMAFARNIWMIYIGMFFFGAGSETLIIAQSSIISRWFKGKELALAFGIALTVSRLGSLFSYNTEALIVEYFGHYSFALWAGFVFCLLSLLANVVYCVLDRRGEHVLDLEEGAVEEKIVVSDIRKFNASFWYVTLLCFTFYGAIFPFQHLAADFFHEKWGIPLEAATGGGFFTQVFSNFIHMFSTASGITGIIIFASMIFAPLAGALVDRIGKRATLMIFGSLMMIPAHLLMGITHVNPVFMMFVLGAAFVLVPAAMWPSVPLIIPENRVGTAFGLMTMLQNIGLGLFPWLSGRLRDVTGDYTASQVMFALLGLLGLVFAILLKIADSRNERVLEKP
ncbi:MAG: MFS transporter [Candidatus Krumholzibacteriota bacterium]|nr:MFS transporter [Candidatus Krumholzibacteriota bacterium]